MCILSIIMLSLMTIEQVHTKDNEKSYENMLKKFFNQKKENHSKLNNHKFNNVQLLEDVQNYTEYSSKNMKNSYEKHLNLTSQQILNIKSEHEEKLQQFESSKSRGGDSNNLMNVKNQVKKQLQQTSGNVDLIPFYQNFLTCAACQAIQVGLQTFMLDTENDKAFVGFAGLLCTNALGYQNETCALRIRFMTKELQANLFQQVLSKDFFCRIVIPVCTSPTYTYYNLTDYQSRLTQSKPSSVRSDNYINNLYDSIAGQNGRASYSILHISDPHVDYMYNTSSSSKCGGLICCRYKDGTDDPLANPKGEKSCDTPQESFQAMLNAIKFVRQPDLILVTGGLVARDLKATESDIADAQMFAAVGTDEFLPNLTHHMFFRNPTRLQKLATELKLRTSINDTARAEFTNYGYYSVFNMNKNSRTSTLQNVMLIVLNTMSCYTYNSGTLRDANDAGSQLAWLEGRLKYAENNNWQAIIMGHIPPGNENCNRQFAKRYNVLMERFQNIVRLQTFGYEGTDSFKVIRSTTSGLPIGVIQVGGSLGTHTYNPSARVYTMDAQYHIPTQIDVLNFNLEVAQQTGSWVIDTQSYPQSYGMVDNSPKEYAWLSQEVSTTPDVSNRFYNKIQKLWSEDLQCIGECANDLHCKLNYADNEEALQCRNKLFDLEYGLPYVSSYLQNPWVAKT
eukprot:403333694